MDSTEEAGISLIITEDGQYNLMNVDQTGAANVSEFSEATEVILQQANGGVEVMYIVQPEVGDDGMTYAVEGMVGTDGVNLVDVNGEIIHTSQSEIDSNSVIQLLTEMSPTDMPDEAGDKLIDKNTEDDVNNESYAEQEEEVSILMFCQYCGENLLTLEDLNTHLKEEHGVDEMEEIQSDEDGADEVKSVFPSCSTCGSTFLDERDLKDHRKKCCPEEAEESDTEPDNDVTSQVLLNQQEVTWQGEHKCQMCARVFMVRSDLDLHIEKGHHDSFAEGHKNTKGSGLPRMYHKCPYCPKMYMSKWHKKSLIKHIKVEHPNEPWDIKFELVDVDNDSSAFRRLNAKKGEYETCFPCIHCNRKFIWQKSLYRHYKDFHPDRLEALSEDERANLFGKKLNRSVADEGGKYSCNSCEKEFIWERSLKKHSLECTGRDRNVAEEDKSLQKSDYILKCLYCSLVSKYTCSMRKHLKRFHTEELGDLDVNKIDIPVVDMESYGHNVISTDKRPADVRLKDCPVVFMCKFCDYATPGQSNLKRHLMSIKHNFTHEQLMKMKLSSFKVVQKARLRSPYKTKKRMIAYQSSSESDGDFNEGNGDKKEHSSPTGNDDFEKNVQAERNEIVKTDGTTESDETGAVPVSLPITPQRTTEKSTFETEESKSSKSSKEIVLGSKSSGRKKVTKGLETEAFLCICKQKFKDFAQFIEHCSRHVNIKVDFICDICEESYPMFESMKKHHNKVHPGLKFLATRLNSISAIEVKSKQSKVRAFECPYCDLILSQSLPLHEHVSENHKKHVISISIKAEPMESVNTSSGERGIVSGFRCGFCECTYCTIQDIVQHMQLIHPFVDKDTLGKVTSDAGSVRKSGRKRKAKYPGFDEEEPTKKQKLDFKSPEPSMHLKEKRSDQPSRSRNVKEKASPGDAKSKATLNKNAIEQVTENKNDGSKDTKTDDENQDEEMMGAVDMEPEKAGNKILKKKSKNRETGKDDEIQPLDTSSHPEKVLRNLKNVNIHPAVNLGKKSEVELEQQPDETPNVPKKKRGRKRKEDKVEKTDSSDIVKKSDLSDRRFSSVTGENKCPHCNFTCKRSSALNFHINFNHTNIKEEPVDPDGFVHFNKGFEGTPKGKRNSAGLAVHKGGNQNKTKVHIKKATVKVKEERVMGQKTKKVQETIEVPDNTYVDDTFDDEDMEMMDDSDGDQDYKPSAATDKDDDYDEDEEEDEFEDDVSDVTSNRYKCLFCEHRNFLSVGILETHVQKEHPEKVDTYSIEECEEIKEDFKLVKLKKANFHKCAYCSKSYNSREKVIKHVKAAHKNLVVAKLTVKREPENVVSKNAEHESDGTVCKHLKGKTKFKCSVCSFLCISLKGLKKHTIRCHPDAMEEIFTTELDMDKDNNMSNSFKCPYCKYKCYYKSSIKRHVKVMHSHLYGEFNADSACAIVPDADREKEKKEKVPEDGHYSCPFCGIINKWKKSIARHIRVVHPTEPYDVEIPPVRLPEIEEVKQSDKRLSIGFNKRLQCLRCTYSCKRLANMKQHMEGGHGITGTASQQAGEADFQYVYQKLGQVERQELLDDGQGEIGIHTCPYCGTTYGWKKSLFFHVKKVHRESLNVFETLDKILNIVTKHTGTEKVKKYNGKSCDKCGIVLKSDLTLKQHRLIKHGVKKRHVPRYTLPRYVTAWRQKNYRLDGRYKSMTCRFCAREFKSLQSLRTHTQIYHKEQKTDCLYASCYARFKWKSSHKLHLKQAHQHGPLEHLEDDDQCKCELCNKIFGSAQQLHSHITESYLTKNATRKPMTYKCKECNLIFDTANLRDQHFSTAHIELTEMCDICGGVFPNKKQLQLHIRRHDRNPSESSIICDHCGMTMTKKSLKKHLLFKHTEKLECYCALCSSSTSEGVISCDLCSRSFCQKLYLYAHKRLQHHIKDRLYACKICHTSFPSQKLRNVHLHEQHLNMKIPPPVDDSANSTMDVWTTEEDKDRTTHVIHVGQDKGAQYLPKLSDSSLTAVIKELVIISNDKTVSKPFKCLLCGRSFGKSKYIKLHIRRNHVKDEDKPYRCKVCGSGFVRLTEFRKHSRSHSGFRPYKCRICAKAFKQQANLLDHMHIHKDSKDFQCFICKRHFQQRGGMTSHILTHDTLKPFKCMFCEKGFTSRGELSRHMQKYSTQLAEAKTFLCHICQTSFPHYPLLLRHIDTHNPEKPFSCEACGFKFGSFMSLYNHKLKMKHFLLTDIQIGEDIEEQEHQLEKTDTQVAVASLEMDLYNNVQPLDEAVEETIYIAQDGYVTENPDMSQGKTTTIIIEPMEAEEIVQTSNKLHDNEELLSIAKQLTELSTYTTENESAVEFSVINDENEIMKDMLDADTDVLASIEKQTTKQRQMAETPRSKIPKTIEEILQIQQLENQVQEETLIEEEQEPVESNEMDGEVVEEEVIDETQINQEQVEVNEIVTTASEMPTNVEELAALIAQNSAGLAHGEGITAYETEDGVILVCMPENVDSSAYEEVLNSAVQSLTGETFENQEQTIQTETEDSEVKELTYQYAVKEESDVPVEHVNINQVPDTERRETFMKLPESVVEQTTIDMLEQEDLNLYGDSENGVVEIENDESTFIKQELLADNYNMASSKFTLDNGVFTYQDCKLRYEISGRILKCLQCGKILKSKKRLKDHLKRHIPMERRENVCMYCSSRFVTGNELLRHLATHTDDRRYKCDQCNKGFRQPGHLTEHQLIHQNIRPHSCSECFLSFRTKRQLFVHTERKHSNVSYMCDECDSLFTSKTSLIIHKGSVHSNSFKKQRNGKGPQGDEGGEHQCHTCGMAFNTRTKLAKHMQLHENKPVKVKKSHMCDVCGAMYQSKEYLKEHMQKVHSDDATIICDKCGDAFKTSRILQLHKRRAHGLNKQNSPLVKKIHPCKICHKPFSTRHALAYHIGSTPACKNAEVAPPCIENTEVALPHIENVALPRIENVALPGIENV